MIGASIKFHTQIESTDTELEPLSGQLAESGVLTPDKTEVKMLQGVVMDKFMHDMNDFYLVVLHPGKEIVFVSPLEVSEIIGLSFGVHSPNGIIK